MNEIKAFEMREAAEAARRQYSSHRPDATLDAYTLAGYVLELLDERPIRLHLTQRASAAEAERDALAARAAALEVAARGVLDAVAVSDDALTALARLSGTFVQVEVAALIALREEARDAR